MAARTTTNTTTVQQTNTVAPTVSTNVKTIQEDPVLINASGGCLIRKVLLQGT